MIDGYAKYEVPFGSFDINEFMGCNVTPTRAASEMREMMNLSSREYPYLSPRRARSEIDIPEGIVSIEKIFRANGKLCFIADGKLWYDGKVVVHVDKGTPKSVAVCNGKICIAPDLVYYDYLNDLFGRMDGRVVIFSNGMTSPYIYKNKMFLTIVGSSTYARSFAWNRILKVGDSLRFGSFEGTHFYFYQCRVQSFSEDGSEVFLDGIYDAEGHFLPETIIVNDKDIIFAGEARVEISTGSLSFSIEGNDNYGANEDEKNSMKQFAKNYLRFEKGDVIKIGSYLVPGTSEVNEDGSLDAKWPEYTITDIDISDTLVRFSISGSSGNGVYKSPVVITRTMPKMDYICEKDNRLFGVCNCDNTVVASKLGQPFNFMYFSGTSLDSYSVEVGSDGEFTGIAPYSSGVVLFKERFLHMLYGSKPSMYRLEGIETYGCQKGCSDSICALGGRIYYRSPRGINVFDGSYPSCISRCLGEEKYYDAVAADDDRRYYVSMADSGGKRLMYVYDTVTGFWHIEDSAGAVSLCELGGDVYIAYPGKVQRIGDGEGNVSWFAVFGPFDFSTENKKVISSVSLRYKLPRGSSMCIEVACDEGGFEVMKEIYYSTDTVVSCDIPIKRCSEFSLRICGKGDVQVRGLSIRLRESTGVK